MLLMGKNYPPCTKMKERSMGFFGFGSQILPKANRGGENCHLHTLWRRSLQETQGAPNTALMSAMHLDCLNENAVALVCENWGHLKWFVNEGRLELAER